MNKSPNKNQKNKQLIENNLEQLTNTLFCIDFSCFAYESVTENKAKTKNDFLNSSKEKTYKNLKEEDKNLKYNGINKINNNKKEKNSKTVENYLRRKRNKSESNCVNLLNDEFQTPIAKKSNLAIGSFSEILKKNPKINNIDKEIKENIQKKNQVLNAKNNISKNNKDNDKDNCFSKREINKEVDLMNKNKSQIECEIKNSILPVKSEFSKITRDIRLDSVSNFSSKEIEVEDEVSINKKEEFIKKEKAEAFITKYKIFTESENYKILFTKEIHKKKLIKGDLNFLDSLYNLYSSVISHGGYFEFLSKSLFSISPFNKIFNNPAKEIYDEFLFHFELHENLNSKKNNLPFKYEASEIPKFKPQMILECKIIEALEADDEKTINEKIESALKCDLVILRNFLPKFCVREDLFTFQYLSEKTKAEFKNFKIDVIEQDPDFYGFMMNKQVKTQWRLADYLEYVKNNSEFLSGNISNVINAKEKIVSVRTNPLQTNQNKKTEELNSKQQQLTKQGSNNFPINKSIIKNDKNEKIKNKKNFNKNKNSVYYGVNIDVSRYPELFKELETCVNPLINFGSLYDLLSYVREHVPGMTLPQMYVKVPKVWTGGHEENLRMQSVNINHGPGNSFWWASPWEDTDQIHRKVKEKWNLDIFKKEGVYFPHFDFFLLNGIRVFYALQQQGDVVLVGPGAIHWVRAQEHSINTSWNFASKDLIQLKNSMERYEINKKIHFRSLVPMKTLLFDMVNKEMFTLNYEYFLETQKILNDEITSSVRDFNKFKDTIKQDKLQISVMHELDEYLVNICENCFDEVFYCWCFCPDCSEKRKETLIIFCIKCFKEHLKTCANAKSASYLFYKYELSDLDFFQARLRQRLKLNSLQVEEINNSIYNEFKQPQDSLLKKTKDRRTISENKNRKNNLNMDKFISPEYLIFYEKHDANKISKNLLKLINQKYEVYKEPVNPLDPQDYLEKLVDLEDALCEEELEYCFSPDCTNYNDKDINNNYDKENYNRFHNENMIIDYNFNSKYQNDKAKEVGLTADAKTNDYLKGNNCKVNTFRHSSTEEENYFSDDENTSSRNSNYHNNLKNNNNNFNLYSNDFKIPKLGNRRNNLNSSFSSDSNLNLNLNKMNNLSNSLKINTENESNNFNNNKNQFNSKTQNFSAYMNFNSQNESFLKKQASDLFINKGNSVNNKDQSTVGFVKSYLSNDKFSFIDSNKNNNNSKEEKFNHKERLSRAIKVVSELAEPLKVNKFRMFSDSNFQLNSSIDILKKNLHQKEILEELKVKDLIEKICENFEIHYRYRQIFDEMLTKFE